MSRRAIAMRLVGLGALGMAVAAARSVDAYDIPRVAISPVTFSVNTFSFPPDQKNLLDNVALQWKLITPLVVHPMATHYSTSWTSGNQVNEVVRATASPCVAGWVGCNVRVMSGFPLNNVILESDILLNANLLNAVVQMDESGYNMSLVNMSQAAFAHEAGHSLGFSDATTVRTATMSANAPLALYGNSALSNTAPTGPQPDDIAGLIAKYGSGVNSVTNSGFSAQYVDNGNFVGIPIAPGTNVVPICRGQPYTVKFRWMNRGTNSVSGVNWDIALSPGPSNAEFAFAATSVLSYVNYWGTPGFETVVSASITIPANLPYGYRWIVARNFASDGVSSDNMVHLGTVLNVNCGLDPERRNGHVPSRCYLPPPGLPPGCLLEPRPARQGRSALVDRVSSH